MLMIWVLHSSDYWTSIVIICMELNSLWLSCLQRKLKHSKARTSIRSMQHAHWCWCPAVYWSLKIPLTQVSSGLLTGYLGSDLEHLGLGCRNSSILLGALVQINFKLSFQMYAETHTWFAVCEDYLHGIDEAYEDLLDDKVWPNYSNAGVELMRTTSTCSNQYLNN